jgi:glycosyltransferase involved in cell wall biosynthesis
VAVRAQLQALPGGRVAVSCSAPLGAGGLGRHLSEILDALAQAGRPASCICGDDAGGPRRAPARHRLGLPYLSRELQALPLPLPPGVRTRAFMVEFDAYAAQHLPDAEHLVAFNGQALEQFEQARRRGFASVGLVSANSHLRQVARQHALAHLHYPLEGSWTRYLVGRNLSEYARADRILYASDYIRDSFLAEGVPAQALARLPLTPHPRFRPPADRVGSERFEVVYVGSLAVHKGVPLLIDAVRRLAHADLRLTLVGGWGTRGMRRFVQAACAADPRIEVRPGDPLGHLQSAALCVHPAYEDGFGYAAAEAAACGVPLLVSEDTGMKELLQVPRDGLILPTGDLDALTEAIDAAYRGELPIGSTPTLRPRTL